SQPDRCRRVANCITTLRCDRSGSLRQSSQRLSYLRGHAMSLTKLSIVIPFYNEAATLGAVLEKVLAVPLEGVSKEVIAVNDGSLDGSKEIAQDFKDEQLEAVHVIAAP